MSEPLIQTMPIASARREVSAFRPMLHSHCQPWPECGQPEQADDPYERGLADGQALAEAIFAVERAQLKALIKAAEAFQPEPSEELAQLIAEAVYSLVRQIVNNAPVDGEWLKQAALDAANSISDCDAARTAWLHPEDVALLADTQLPLTLMGDTTVPRGSIRIDCSAGWIEHGRSIYLDALRSALALEPSA
jgi:flagellar assembly protein FliH